jgi:hypothetical protein
MPTAPAKVQAVEMDGTSGGSSAMKLHHSPVGTEGVRDFPFLTGISRPCRLPTIAIERMKSAREPVCGASAAG